ncbi:MAG: glycoside hydrolase family 127 protein [Bacteroidota bacterium]|nr:glycoside hydrolase family 127 protein [Bacteroidota bacterium]MDP4196287.1 glycoside hydrolase family 127 protein [Bacteroidota bacterium]
MKKYLLSVIMLTTLILQPMLAGPKVQRVNKPSNTTLNNYYVSNRAPLQNSFFIKLPVNSINPKGYVRKALELQRDGLTGNLGKISLWLTKENNAWLSNTGKGEYGWEEVPYWLRGYARIGYMLGDKQMIDESNIWIQATLNNQRENGDFGPIIERNGKRDLWAQMLMLQCLQSYYEFSKDQRVLNLMTRYFKWQLSIPDSLFLKDYWENSRGGDNLYSVYWLYNITGDKWLLELATKIDKNTANWRDREDLPNWHVVNIAECFREPATYYLQSGKQSDLDATYNNFNLAREIYGQVPGGMFGADENARPGYDDPRQASETCSFVEQISSDALLMRITGDSFWAENCEDVVFNSLPAAFMPDYKALRYLTAPNMVQSDSKDHSPGLNNNGPFLMMNPFSSRCCQHNHSSAWVNYAENLWMATPDDGLAAQFYSDCEVSAKAGNGSEVKLSETTHYPFDDEAKIKINVKKAADFPLYLRIPSWCRTAILKINGKNVPIGSDSGSYLKISKKWKDGDIVSIKFPMSIHLRKWGKNKNSLSVNYGPITFSLKIQEKYVKNDSRQTAISDSKWQPSADQSKWPSFEIFPASAWNYGLLVNDNSPEGSFKVIKKSWPKDNMPFTNNSAPIELKVQGKKINAWSLDQYGLCSVLPQSPVKTDQKAETLILVPMGGARLRISAFPEVK